MTIRFAVLGSRFSVRPPVARGGRLGALLAILLTAGAAGAEAQVQSLPAGAATTPPPAIPTQARPSPRATGVEPSVVPSGSDGVSVRVNGENFSATCRVLVDGAQLSADVLGPDQIQVYLPAALLAKARQLELRVLDGEQEGGDAARIVVTVANPVPVLSIIEVPTLAVGQPTARIKLIGKAFRTDSAVLVAGQAIETTFRSAEELTGIIPADLLAAPGTLSVSVATPGPGGGSSLVGQITVTDPVFPGRFVVFTSNRRQGQNHVYLLDRKSNRLDPLQEANSPSGSDAYPSISADGRFIAFQSDRHRGQYDIFVFDRVKRTLDPLPEANHATAFDGFPAISADGRFIVFESDRLGKPKVFLFDLQTRTLSELTHANEATADDGLAAISN